jgi:hypothetical protein
MEERDPQHLAHFLPEIVLLSKAKRTFKKGYLPNWTEELFTVVKCIETRTPVYLVKDDHGEILEGKCYAKRYRKSLNRTTYTRSKAF